jgi:hypothetical protein
VPEQGCWAGVVLRVTQGKKKIHGGPEWAAWPGGLKAIGWREEKIRGKQNGSKAFVSCAE